MGSTKKFKSWKDSLGFRQVRRIVIFVIGMTVLLVGVALLVLPGPAFIVIPAGLGILGLEFRWARRWMKQAKAMLKKGMKSAKNRVRGANTPPPEKDETARSATRPLPSCKLDS